MATDNPTDHVWDMMKKINICMLTTYDGENIRSRPMASYLRREQNLIYFMTDVRAHKDEEITKYPAVCLAFADAGNQNYVSVMGRASVSEDRAKLRELWNPIAKAWWDSPEDPNLRLLTVDPQGAEYWDSPGSVVSYVKMLTAAVTGNKPDMGDNKKVAM